MLNRVITKVKDVPLIGVGSKELIWTLGLTAVAIITPAILAHAPQNQWLTGSIVNAVLFLAAWKVPLGNAFFVAAMPSSVALMRGLLPAPMALLLPYIIFSNFLLIITYAAFKKTPLLGVVGASLAKFAFLYATTMFLSGALVGKLLVMFQWPQLITALAGGLIFLSITSIGKKIGV